MSYVYPFGSGVTVERIDQGQDFGGTGPIKAIGKAKIISTGAPGWPGGGGVLYRLLEGALAGKYIYVNEGIRPSVKAGQLVEAGATIGTLIPGSSTGIEMGFANANGEPISHAEYAGKPDGFETKGGKAMAALLKSIKGGGEGGGNPLDALGGAVGEVGGAVGEVGGEVAGEVGKEAAEGIVELLTEHAEPLMLNIGLVLGGAFLVYYGIGLVSGAKKPGHSPAPPVPIP